jgi:hypothetical protein
LPWNALIKDSGRLQSSDHSVDSDTGEANKYQRSKSATTLPDIVAENKSPEPSIICLKAMDCGEIQGGSGFAGSLENLGIVSVIISCVIRLRSSTQLASHSFVPPISV